MYLTLLDNCNNFDFILGIKDLFYFKYSNGIALLSHNVNFYIIDYYNELSGYLKPLNFLGSSIALYSTDLANFNDISIKSSNCFKLSYTGICILTPYQYVFIPKLCSYLWYISIIIFKLLNSPLIKLLLAGLLYCLL